MRHTSTLWHESGHQEGRTNGHPLRRGFDELRAAVVISTGGTRLPQLGRKINDTSGGRADEWSREIEFTMWPNGGRRCIHQISLSNARLVTFHGSHPSNEMQEFVRDERAVYCQVDVIALRHCLFYVCFITLEITNCSRKLAADVPHFHKTFIKSQTKTQTNTRCTSMKCGFQITDGATEQFVL